MIISSSQVAPRRNAPLSSEYTNTVIVKKISPMEASETSKTSTSKITRKSASLPTLPGRTSKNAMLGIVHRQRSPLVSLSFNQSNPGYKSLKNSIHFCISVRQRLCKGFLPLQTVRDMEQCDGQVYNCADRSDEDNCPPHRSEKTYVVSQVFDP